MRKITVKQDPENEVPTEVLAKSIQDIAEGVRALRKGRLRDKALFLLIQHALPIRDRPTISQIEAVFDGIEGMSRTYLKA